ncbi:hypothetical protein Tco_0176543 [Tanacetum coccineum]
MKQQVISVALMATFVLLLLSFTPTRASRTLDGDFRETWMKGSNLLLSSLQSRKPPLRSPGNGCNSTGNGGNPCIGSKKVAGHPNAATAPPPPEFSKSLVQIREAASS